MTRGWNVFFFRVSITFHLSRVFFCISAWRASVLRLARMLLVVLHRLHPSLLDAFDTRTARLPSPDADAMSTRASVRDERAPLLVSEADAALGREAKDAGRRLSAVLACLAVGRGTKTCSLSVSGSSRSYWRSAAGAESR